MTLSLTHWLTKDFTNCDTKNNPIDFRLPRYLIRVMRRHVLTYKKTETISLVKYYETIEILLQIFLYLKLHFENDACPWQKNIFRCFFDRKVIYLCAEFPLCQTPATDFLPINITFFVNIWLEYFFNKFLRVFHQSKVELSDLGENWAKTSPLLFQIFESSNCVYSHIVQWCNVIRS